MSFSRNEKGQGLVEYILILVLVFIVVVAAYLVLKPVIDPILHSISSTPVPTP